MRKKYLKVMSFMLALAVVVTSIPFSAKATETGTEILNEDFTAGIDETKWSLTGTPTTIKNEEFQSFGGTNLVYKNQLDGWFSVEYDLKLNECDGWNGIRIGMPALDSTHDTAGVEMLFINSSGQFTLLKENKSGTIAGFDVNTSVKVKIEYKLGTLNFYFNESTTPDATINDAKAEGFIGFYTNGSPTKAALLDNIIVKTYEDETSQSNVDDVASSISAPNIVAGDTKLTMPVVPGGYTIETVSSSNESIIALDGTINQADTDQTINLVFKVTYTSKVLSSNTASLSVVVPQKITQDSVDARADMITDIPAPILGKTQVILPEVPEGYELKIKTSSDEEIVDKYGSILLAADDQTVELVLTLTHIKTGISSETESISLTIPGVGSSIEINKIIDEDFESDSLDTDIWSIAGTESTVENGVFNINSGSFLRSVKAVGSNYVIEYDMKLKDCVDWMGLLFNGSNLHDHSNNWDNGNSLMLFRATGPAGINVGGIGGNYVIDDTNEFVRVKVEVMDEILTFYMNGQLIGSGEFVGLEESYFSFYNNGGTAISELDNIRVTTYEKPIDLEAIAAQITSINEIMAGDKRIVFPKINPACNIEIYSSSNESVITKDGLISQGSKAENVELVFKITSSKVDGFALTSSINVKVPAATSVANEGMKNFLLSKYGLFIHYVPRLTVNEDGSKIMSGSGTELENLDEFAKAFDVPTFVQDAVDMNVEYVIVTAWHANMVSLYPSQAMKDYDLENHQVSGRDLIGEIIDGLNQENIDVYLYTHPRDGHDFPADEAAKVGWTTSGTENPVFDTFNKQLWNDFVNDVYGELIDKYGTRIKGLFIDEGSAAADSYRVVDYQRLRETIKSRNENLVLMHNFYGTTYSTDVGVKEYFYWGEKDPNSGGANGNQWPAYEIPVATGIAKGGWWANNKSTDDVCDYSAEDMFRYTVLQAAVNTKGGGVSWAAGPYTYGDGWEKNIKERLVAMGNYIKPIEESIKRTYPSTSFLTKSGSTTGMLTSVATMSEDKQKEYIHVLNAPSSGNSLLLGVPEDGKVFNVKAKALNDGTSVIVLKNETSGAISLQLEGKNWSDLTNVEKLDYVIELTVVDIEKVEETFEYIDNTDRGILYGGSGWSLQRWYRHNSYSSNWQTTVGGDYDGDIHISSSNGAYIEVPFSGTGIAYLPSKGPGNTNSCDIYIDGVLKASNVSLNNSVYAPNQNVFEIKNLENTNHTLKIVNTGSGALVSDAYKIYNMVEKISVENVELNQTEAGVKVGETITLKETVAPADATNKAVTWTSSDEAIATVVDGVVTGVKKGSATITATTEDGGKVATCAIKVSETIIPVTEIKFDKSTLTIIAGKTATLNATVIPANATNKTLRWSSSDDTIASISAEGVITALKAGTVTITATSADQVLRGGVVTSCVVTILSDQTGPDDDDKDNLQDNDKENDKDKDKDKDKDSDDKDQSKEGNTPKTGDSSPITWFVSLLVLSLASVSLVSRRKVKK